MPKNYFSNIAMIEILLLLVIMIVVILSGFPIVVDNNVSDSRQYVAGQLTKR